MAAVLLAAVIALLMAGRADAAFENVGEFGGVSSAPFGEGEIANDPGGIAVDRSTGDVYEADGSGGRVVEFGPEGIFIAAWGWGVGDDAERYERCGPEQEFLTCEGTNQHGHGINGEGPGQFTDAEAVAVDEATGDVYVATGNKTGAISVFSSAGEYLANFGDEGVADAEEIQAPRASDGLAVDAAGNVYRLDAGERFGPRVVEFSETTPGVPSSYGYDRALFGPTQGGFARGADGIALEASGGLYLARESRVYRFADSNAGSPIWEHSGTGIEAIGSGPVTGGLFYYSTGNKYRRLTATGEELEAFPGLDAQEGIAGMAFSTEESWRSERAAGVLYADSPLAPLSHHRQAIAAFAPPLSFPPKAITGGGSTVGANFATLTGEVNPAGFTTHYVFEYGTAGPCSEAECAEAPSGGATLSTSTGQQTVQATIQSLVPETAYYYRIVATNQYGTTDGADQSFRTQPPPQNGLPDNRRYALVSPSEKDGGEAFPLAPEVTSCGACEPGKDSVLMPMMSSPDGDAVAYEGTAFDYTSGAVGENEYISTRVGGGWQTRDISPEQEAQGSGGFEWMARDLTSGVIAQAKPVLAPGAPGGGYEDLYRWSADGESLTPLIAATPPDRSPTGENGFTVEVGGASEDASAIVFVANDALTQGSATEPAAPNVGPSTRDIYEWRAGTTRLINVLPEEMGAAPHAGLGRGALKAASESAPDYSHAVSANGERVFWTDEVTGRLYLWSDGTSVEIPDAGHFLTASETGGRVLLDDGHIYDVETATTTDLTDGLGGFQGILGASADLSLVYFVDNAALTGSEDNAYGASATTGEENLYVYDEASASTRYIATLSPNDVHTEPGSITGAWEAAPVDRVAQVTADGEYVAFESVAKATGYENMSDSGRCAAGCTEVFEYHLEDSSLRCVSCNTANTPPVGPSILSIQEPVNLSHFTQPDNLLSNGRVFFDSGDQLSASDANPGVFNVYEYEPAGLGTCQRSAGCVGLLSSGHSGYDATFVSASASGSDVFFATRARLVSADNDELVDLYDATEEAVAEEAEQPSSCSGEGCRGAAATPEATELPASAEELHPEASLAAPTEPAPAGSAPPSSREKKPVGDHPVPCGRRGVRGHTRVRTGCTRRSDHPVSKSTRRKHRA